MDEHLGSFGTKTGRSKAVQEEGLTRFAPEHLGAGNGNKTEVCL